MNKEPTQRKYIPKEGETFKRGVSNKPKNLVPPVAPTTPPPKK